jgi:hypothetical protein
VGPEGSLQTGITFGIQVPGLVPFYEEALARQKAGYTEPEWADLEPLARARSVALYRLEIYRALHESGAQARQIRKDRRRR